MESLRQATIGIIRRGARNVTRNPTRLALIVALLGTGLMFVAAMVALNGSAQRRLQAARDEIGTGVDIRPSGSYGPLGDTSKALSLAQVRAAEHVPGVVGAVESITRLYDRQDIKGAIQGKFLVQGSSGGATESNVTPFIYGFSPGLSSYPLFTGGTARVTAGRNLTATDSDAALTSQAIASANGWHLGSTFAVDGTSVTLVGLVDSGSAIDNNAIILPIQTARSIYHISGATRLTVYAASDSLVPGVVSTLERTLGSQFAVVSAATSYASTLSALQSAQSNIFVALVAAIVTTALIIVFSVALIVRERVQEIGLLKALGASHWQVVGQFGVEVLALSGVAAAIAAFLLAVLGPILARKFDISPANAGGSTLQNGVYLGKSAPVAPLHSAAQALSLGLTPGTLALILLFGIGLAALASAIPAWAVARINPADVLRAN